MSRLNDTVPYDTIIRVLLKVIKNREEEIDRLNEELKDYRNPHRFLEMEKDIPQSEREKMKNNIYYKKLRAKVANMEKQQEKMKEDERRLIHRLAVATKIVDDFFTP